MMHKVLILPGAGCPPSMYTSWLKSLADRGHDAAVVTYPGHGPGEDPGGITTNACEEHVEQLIRERGKKERPFVLIGHSYGGLIAMRVAQGNPKVRGLLLVSPAPPHGVSIGLVAQARLLRHATTYGPAMISGKSFSFHNDDIQHHFLSGRQPVDESGAVHSFGLESGSILRRLVFDKLVVEPESIHCPVHIFSGSDDRLFTLDVHLALRNHLNRSCTAAYPMAQLHRLPNVTHMPMFGETAAPITSILMEYVDKTLAPSDAKIAAE